MLAVTGGMACDGAHSSRGSAAWPVVATARERVKRPRVGFLMHLAPGDPDAMARVAGFLQGLQELGWATDRNIHIDYRWAVGQAELYRKYAAELVALQPDVLVTAVTDSVRALQRATRTIPIVFTSVIDPVGSGLITSLSHPGGNATGFSLFEFGISGKWLELLKQIAPSVTRVAVLRDSDSTRGVGQFAAIQANASSFGVDLLPLDAHEGSDIDRAIGAFAGRAGSGLIGHFKPNCVDQS
jgi:putative ABC transport system substrate-binding protein